MLTTVTLTGADESVRPHELFALSREFPFVEWGILVGDGRAPRFPPWRWIRQLIQSSGEPEDIRLALHVCGRQLRNISEGNPTLELNYGPQIRRFQRVQLNWHGEPQRPGTDELILQSFCKMEPWDPTIIFQFDGVNDELWRPAGRRFRCAALFDQSHGAGVLPTAWGPMSPEIQSGWAGGLGPDNVVRQAMDINSRASATLPHWIDMETKLRSDDDARFDLAKCRSVLEQMAPFIQEVDES